MVNDNIPWCAGGGVPDAAAEQRAALHPGGGCRRACHQPTARRLTSRSQLQRDGYDRMPPSKKASML